MMNKKIILLILILGLALFLRLYRAASTPPALYWDEAAMALDAQAIAQTGKDQHGNSWLQAIYPSWGDYKLPGYIISAVPFFIILKNNPELAIRLPSVVAGTLTVLVIYLLTKELFSNFTWDEANKPPSKTPGFKNSNPGVEELAALLLAISPWHLQFSRAAFEGNLSLFFNALALLFFLKAKNNKLWLSPFSIFSVFSVYTYYSARIVMPLIIILAFLIFWKISPKSILNLLLSAIFVIFLCLPLRLSPIANKAEQFRLSTKNILNDGNIIQYSSQLIEQDTNFILAKKFHHRFLYQAKVLAAHYFDHFSLNFLLLNGDPNLRHSTGRIGVLLIVGVIGLALGEYGLFIKRKKIFIFLNLSLLISFLPACVPYEVPHSLRSLNGVIFINIISAYGLFRSLFIPTFQSGPRAGLCLAGAVYCLLFTQTAFYLHDYYIHYPSRSYFAWQGGYKEAVKLVDQEYARAEKIIFTNAYARAYLYFLLYSHYPIKEFQKSRQEFLTKHPWDFLETEKVGKIEFRTPKEEDKSTNGLLMIGTPGELSGKGVKVINPAFNLWKNF